MASASPAPFLSSAAPLGLPLDELLRSVLDLSLTGLVYYLPVYDLSGSGEVVDFAFHYLNPAAQRMLRLPDQPPGTHLDCFPESRRNGSLAFHRDTFLSGESGTFEINYQADGYDNFFRVAARRAGTGLLVSFTDTADQPRTPVEIALHESQAREQQVRAKAEHQRGELQRLFEQTSVAMALFQGPEYVIELANEPMAAIWGRRLAQVLGQPVFSALPYVRGQGFEAIFADVLAQGTPYDLHEVPVTIDRAHLGHPEQGYFNLTYRPQRDAQGRITGIITSAYEITEQVRARQQVEQFNAELEAHVAERTRELKQLNQELEARVQERTRQLADQQAMLQQIQSQVPAYLVTFRGPNHVYTYFNKAYGHDLAQGRAELGRPLVDCFPELVEQGFIAALDAVYASGQPIILLETPVVLTDPLTQHERTVYVNMSYHRLHTEAGDPQGMLGFATDVTEQVLAQRERDTQRQQLQAVFAQAPVAVCVFRGEDAVLDVVNPSMAEMLGHPLAALVGRPFLEVLPELHSQGLHALLAEVRRTGTPFVAQEQQIQLARHRPGEPGYFNYVYQPLLADDGRVTGIVFVATDVTEQVRARAQVEQLNQELEARVEERTRQLSEQQQLLRQILRNVPAYIATLSGPEHRYTFFNELYHTFSADRTALGLSVAEVYPEVVSQGFIGLLDQVYATGEPFVGTSTPALLLSQETGQPEQHYVDFIYQPLFDEEHRVQGILVFILDVTDKVRAHQQAEQSQQQVYDLNEQLAAINEELTATNEELHESNTQLVRTNVDLDNFIYTASHDLKAPITNIEGLLYLLREELPADVIQTGNVAPTLTHLFDAVERFKRTIDHLTEVSKLQKEHTPDLAAVDLAAVVEDVRQDLAPLLRATNAQLTVAVTDFPAILFSEKNLRSVVYNLLSNALKYRHPDRRPHVDVQAHVQGRFTVLEVHDNGLGIGAVHLPRLFTMFQRFHTHVEGTGIGLFMIKRMVENAGGRLEVHSQLGAGTTFFVHLPHAPVPSAR